jgi:hypothetical protein
MRLKKEYEGSSCMISKRNTRCKNVNTQDKKIPSFIDVKRMGRFFPQDLD